ncbi:MAG: carbohydrate ABC transporter permease [Ilumatobacter sp.]|jgi:ABC-type glycerol-3-phosphate transport system permease component|uniref:carbohydrate ABC transporter permease n=1 Tax=Ilumatobacter sp. TaxID=1967498 RepID=UPI00391D122D
MSVRRRGVRASLVRGGTYALLVLVAGIVIFPFVVAVSTAFKASTDIFTYPPSLVPKQNSTVPATAVGGSADDDPLEVYTLPERDGDFALVQNGVSLGVYVALDDLDSDAPTEIVADLDAAEPVGTSIVVDGDEEAIVTVATADGPVEAIRIRTTVGARFQSLDDPTETVDSLVNAASPAQEFGPRFANFPDVLDGKDLGRSLTNTVLVTLGVVAGQVLTSILGGYAFARLKFRGRDKLFLLYLGSVMIPFVVLIVPLFQLMVQLNWRDNLVALIIPFIFWAYGTFLMRQFFIGIPVEIEEAALLDGASRFKILWRIMVPLARPAIASLATFGFLYAWNSFLWPFVIINSGNPDSFVLPVSLAQLGGRSSTDTNLAFAGAVIAMTPPIMVFLFAQRYFVENSASSGIK